MENNSWKDIKGYEGLYQISNSGEVKSLGNSFSRKEKILSKGIEGKGYYCVNLCKNGKSKQFKVHRLVATTFIHKGYSKKEVNHKDGNKLNNNIENLEWVTSSENRKHAYNIGLRNTKKVSQFSKDGILIKNWMSIVEAQEGTGISRQNISSCCRGKTILAGGFRWKYTNT